MIASDSGKAVIDMEIFTQEEGNFKVFENPSFFKKFHPGPILTSQPQPEVHVSLDPRFPCHSFQSESLYRCRLDIILLHDPPPQWSFGMKNLMDWMGIYPMKKS